MPDGWRDRKFVEKKVDESADKHGVPRDFAHRVVNIESSYDPYIHGVPIKKLGGQRAYGLMQLIPGTARRLKVNRYDPEQNLEGGMRDLGRLYKKYGGNEDMVYSAHNAGEGAVDKYKGVPPFKETRTALARMKTYKPRRGAASSSAFSAPTPGSTSNPMPSYDSSNYIKSLSEGLQTLKEAQRQQEASGEPVDEYKQLEGLASLYSKLSPSYRQPAMAPEAPPLDISRASNKRGIHAAPAIDEEDKLEQAIAYSASQDGRDVPYLADKLEKLQKRNDLKSRIAVSKSKDSRYVPELEAELTKLESGPMPAPQHPQTLTGGFLGEQGERMPFRRLPAVGEGLLQGYRGESLEEASRRATGFRWEDQARQSREAQTEKAARLEAYKTSLTPDDIKDAEARFLSLPARGSLQPSPRLDAIKRAEIYRVSRQLANMATEPQLYDEKEKAKLLYLQDKLGIPDTDIQGLKPKPAMIGSPEGAIAIAARGLSKVPRGLMEDVAAWGPVVGKSLLNPGAGGIPVPVVPDVNTYQRIVESKPFQSASKALQSLEKGVARGTAGIYDPNAPGYGAQIIGGAAPFFAGGGLVGKGLKAIGAAPRVISAVSRGTVSGLGAGMNTTDIVDQIDAQGKTAPDYWQRRMVGTMAAGAIGTLEGALGAEANVAGTLRLLPKKVAASRLGQAINSTFKIAANTGAGKAEQAALIQSLGRLGRDITKATERVGVQTGPVRAIVKPALSEGGEEVITEGLNAYNEAKIAGTDPNALTYGKLAPRLGESFLMGAAGGTFFSGVSGETRSDVRESINRMREAETVKQYNSFLENGSQGEGFERFLTRTGANINPERQAQVKASIGTMQEAARAADDLRIEIEQVGSGEKGQPVGVPIDTYLDTLKEKLAEVEEAFGGANSAALEMGRKLNARNVPLPAAEKQRSTVKPSPQPGEIREEAEEGSTLPPVEGEAVPQEAPPAATASPAQEAPPIQEAPPAVPQEAAPQEARRPSIFNKAWERIKGTFVDPEAEKQQTGSDLEKTLEKLSAMRRGIEAKKQPANAQEADAPPATGGEIPASAPPVASTGKQPKAGRKSKAQREVRSELEEVRHDPETGWLKPEQLEVFEGTASSDIEGRSESTEQLKQDVRILKSTERELQKRGSTLKTPYALSIKQRLAEINQEAKLRRRGQSLPSGKRYIEDTRAWAARANPYNIARIPEKTRTHPSIKVPYQVQQIFELRRDIDDGKYGVVLPEFRQMLDRQIALGERASKDIEKIEADVVAQGLTGIERSDAVHAEWAKRADDLYKTAIADLKLPATETPAPSAAAPAPVIPQAAPLMPKEKRKVTKEAVKEKIPVEKPLAVKQVKVVAAPKKKDIVPDRTEDLTGFILDKPGKQITLGAIAEQAKALNLTKEQTQSVIQTLERGTAKGQIEIVQGKTGPYARVLRRGESVIEAPKVRDRAAERQARESEDVTVKPRTTDEQKQQIRDSINSYLKDRSTGGNERTMIESVGQKLKANSVSESTIKSVLADMLKDKSLERRGSRVLLGKAEREGKPVEVKSEPSELKGDSKKLTDLPPSDKDLFLKELNEEWTRQTPDFSTDSYDREWWSNARYVVDDSHKNAPVIYVNPHGFMAEAYSSAYKPDQSHAVIIKKALSIGGSAYQNVSDVRKLFGQVQEALESEGHSTSHLDEIVNFLKTVPDSKSVLLLPIQISPERRATALAHELLHAWQHGVIKERGRLLPPDFWENKTLQAIKQKISKGLLGQPVYKGKSDLIRMLNVESATNVADGNFKLTNNERVAFLDHYFQSIVDEHGLEVLDNLVDAAPMVQEVKRKIGEQYGRTDKESSTVQEGRAGDKEVGSGSDQALRGGEALDAGKGVEKGRQESPRQRIGPFRYDRTPEVDFSLSVSSVTPEEVYKAIGHSLTDTYRLADPKNAKDLTRLDNLIDETIDKIEELSSSTHATIPGTPFKIKLDNTLPGARLKWALKKVNKLYLAKPLRGKINERINEISKKQANTVTKLAADLEAITTAWSDAAEAQAAGKRNKAAERKYEHHRRRIVTGLGKIGEYSKGGDYLTRWNRAAIFSAPAIPIWNILQQGFATPLHLAQRSLDWTVPAAFMGKVGFDYEKRALNRVNLTDAARRGIYTFTSTLGKESWNEAGRMARYGFTRQMASVMDAQRQLALNRGKAGAELYELGNRPRYIPVVDRFIVGVGRLQGIADVFGRNMSFALALTSEAERLAKNYGKEQGMDKAAIVKLWNDLIDRPSAEMIAIAADESSRFVLDYPTWAYEKLMQGRMLVKDKLNRPGTQLLNSAFTRTFDLLAPITKIPLAAVDQAFGRYSPVGIGRFVYRLQAEKGRIKRQEVNTRTPIEQDLYARDTAELWRQGEVGSVIWLTASILGKYVFSALTAGDDERERVDNTRALLNEGYDPEVKILGHGIPLKKLGPIGYAMSALGATYQASRVRRDPLTGEEEPIHKTLERAMAAGIGSVAKDNPIGNYVKGLYNLSAQGQEASAAASVGEVFGDRLASMVPGIAQNIAREMYPDKVQSEEQGVLSDLERSIRKALPWKGEGSYAGRGSLTPQLGATGEPIKEQASYMGLVPGKKIATGSEANFLRYLQQSGIGIPRPKRGKETAEEYNTRIRDVAKLLKPRLEQLRESDVMERPEAERRGILAKALETEQLERYGKITPYSRIIEDMSNAVRGNAYSVLVQDPEYKALPASAKAAARQAINDELTEFRAKISAKGEKAASYPWKPPSYLAALGLRAGQAKQREVEGKIEEGRIK